MAQKGQESRKNKVMAGEQVRRNGTASHKNFEGRKEKTQRQGKYNCSVEEETVDLL